MQFDDDNLQNWCIITELSVEVCVLSFSFNLNNIFPLVILFLKLG